MIRCLLRLSTDTGKAPKHLGSRRPTIDSIYQANAPSYLSQLSNGQNEFFSTYRYIERLKGKISWIYVLDTGFDEARADSDDIEGLYVEQHNASDADDTDDLLGRGTDIALLAVGRKTGVARNSSLVTVKLTEGNDAKVNRGSIVKGIFYAMNDIVEWRQERRSVIHLL